MKTLILCVIAVLTALLARQLSPLHSRVSVKDLLAVEAELAHQAGTSQADEMLLDAMWRAATGRDEKAEVARRRCALRFMVGGPSETTVSTCREAEKLGNVAGGEFLVKGRRRLAVVLAHVNLGEALTILSSLPLSAGDDPIDDAMTAWVQADLAGRCGSHALALRWADKAHGLVERAAADPNKAEFLAIADYYLGRSLANVGDSRAMSVLKRGIDRQVRLDEANPEYAEYRLWLIRLYLEAGKLTGGESELKRGMEMLPALNARDPLRWEYTAGGGL